MNSLPELSSTPFAELDLAFGAFAARSAEAESAPLVAAAAALVSRNLRAGSICLDLRCPPALQPLPNGLDPWPSVETWHSALAAAGALGNEDRLAPFVLEPDGRLYLRRYWLYEREIARQIVARLEIQQVDTKALGGVLAALFPQPDSADLQRAAVIAAVARRFAVVSGGPGTGKTTTALRILAALQALAPAPLAVAVAAPTGKAAARLSEAIAASHRSLPTAMQGALTAPSASTIHRLLGARRDSIRFRHDENHPLPHDVVLLDEASMADVPLLAKLLRALRPEARLILLGDRDQLASVEAGSALSDIAHAAEGVAVPAALQELHLAATGQAWPDSEHSGTRQNQLGGAVVQLRRNYRFGNQSQIHAACVAARAGDADGLIKALQSGSPDVSMRPLPSRGELATALRSVAEERFAPYLGETDPSAALLALGSFRLLGATRLGPYGIEALNDLVAAALRAKGLMDDGQGGRHGLPVLVGENDYNVELFNGDIGLFWRDAETGKLDARFFGAGGMLRRILPQRLPRWEAAWAMTVHKCQGSEFERTLLILPDHETPILTRELLYTGLSRAKSHVEVWASPETLRRAVANPIRRASGLAQRLAST
jgi:exodeoxyribonuclease V alpha subunit